MLEVNFSRASLRKEEKAVQEESIPLANGWIPGKKAKGKKGKKGKIWAEICTAACRQGDPLACCLLLACQRKFCPCLGSSALSPAWLCAALPGGQWWWEEVGALHVKASACEVPAKQQVPIPRHGSAQPPPLCFCLLDKWFHWKLRTNRTIKHENNSLKESDWCSHSYQ